jgi:hypothetical protein
MAGSAAQVLGDNRIKVEMGGASLWFLWNRANEMG